MKYSEATATLAMRLDRLRASTRLIICFGIAIAALAACLLLKLAVISSVLLAWDVFCLAMIVLSWIMFAGIRAEDVRRQAQRQDESRYGTFLLGLCAVCVSMVGILLLIRSAGELPGERELHRVVSLFGVALSWMLLHTLFTLRYAHLYYKDPIEAAATGGSSGGLEFPDDAAPDYLDFAYFSFVLGMTFQVSDVTISDRGIRRIALLHSLISFAFNTIVVALSVSLLSGFGK